MRARRWFAATAFASVTLAGCGSTRPTTATLAQFDARANAICARLESEQGAISTWREDASISRIADNEFAAIPRPSAQESAISRLADRYFEEAAVEEEIAAAAEQVEPDHWRAALVRFGVLVRADADKALQLGIPACAKALKATSAHA
jgi:hypothetical protein